MPVIGDGTRTRRPGRAAAWNRPGFEVTHCRHDDTEQDADEHPIAFDSPTGAAS